MEARFCRGLSTAILFVLVAMTAVADETGRTLTASNGGPYYPGSTISLYASSSDPAATYMWSGPNGFTSADQNPTIPGGAAGSYTVTSNDCHSTTSVVVNPNSSISAPARVTSTSAGNSASGPDAAASYLWSIDNGTLTGGQYEQNVTFVAGAAGTLTLTLDTGCSRVSQDVVVDPQPTITISDFQHAEGNSGYTPFEIPVTLSNPSSQIVTVQYYTSNSIAIEGSDYFGIPLTTLTFYPGDVTRFVTVQVIGDKKKEGNELFVVTLINPTNATRGAKFKGWVTITNDD